VLVTREEIDTSRPRDAITGDAHTGIDEARRVYTGIITEDWRQHREARSLLDSFRSHEVKSRPLDRRFSGSGEPSSRREPHSSGDGHTTLRLSRAGARADDSDFSSARRPRRAPP